MSNDPGDFRVMLLRAGTPYEGHPNVVWDGYGYLTPAPGYRWRSSSPNVDGYSVLPLPAGTPHSSLPHVVWSGDGRHFHPAEGYAWLSSDASDNRTVPLASGTPHSSLPHVVWSGDGRLQPASGYQWRNERLFQTQPVPAGTPHERYPNVVWDGAGGVLPKDGYRFVRGALGSNPFQVEPAPAGTPSTKLKNVVWTGDGRTLRPAEGYQWASANPASDGYRVLPRPRGMPDADHENVVWDGNGNRLPAPGFRWASTASDTYEVEPLPANSPHGKYPNVVWTGDGVHIRPADGYRWASEKPSENGYAVVSTEVDRLQREEEERRIAEADRLEAEQDKAQADKLLRQLNRTISDIRSPESIRVTGLEFKTRSENTAAPVQLVAKASVARTVPPPSVPNAASESVAAIGLADHLSVWLNDPMHRGWVGDAVTIALLPSTFGGLLDAVALSKATPAVSLWEDRPPGVQLRRYGDWWVKRVNQEASPIMQWWGRINIQSQYDALQALGSRATPNYLREGVLFTRDVGPVLPDGSRFLNPLAREAYFYGSRIIGPINDIQPRNMGANGLIFDPAIDPVVKTLLYGSLAGELGVATYAMKRSEPPR